jgi:hypothetical protein
MIYFPLQADAGSQSSWADVPLKFLGYERNPKRLQAAIKQVYEKAIKNIHITGTKVLPCAFFETLGGRNPDDYNARVEPSVHGGRKMAQQLVGIIEEAMKND